MNAYGEGTRGWRAQIRQDGEAFIRRGIGITLGRIEAETSEILLWPITQQRHVENRELSGRRPEFPDGMTDTVYIEEDAARALYEALAEHFGHTGHDTRALRRDYEHERGRVDRLIGFLTGEARRA